MEGGGRLEDLSGEEVKPTPNPHSNQRVKHNAIVP